MNAVEDTEMNDTIFNVHYLISVLQQLSEVVEKICQVHVTHENSQGDFARSGPII